MHRGFERLLVSHAIGIEHTLQTRLTGHASCVPDRRYSAVKERSTFELYLRTRNTRYTQRWRIFEIYTPFFVAGNK